MKCIHYHEGGAYCDKHDHGAVTVGCCGEESCPDRKVLTNADRIRAMTDAELARFMYNGCDAIPSTWCRSQPNCDMCWLLWLKAPVEVEE